MRCFPLKKTPSHLSDLSVIVWFWLQKNLPPKEVAWFKGQKPWTWSIFGGRGFKQELKVFWCWDFHPQELLLSLVPFGPLRYINIHIYIYTFCIYPYIHTCKNSFFRICWRIFSCSSRKSMCLYISFLVVTICPRYGFYKHAVTGLTRLHFFQLEGEEEMPEEPDAGATAPLGPQKYLYNQVRTMNESHMLLMSIIFCSTCSISWALGKVSDQRCAT